MPLNSVERGIIGGHFKHLKNYPNPGKKGTTEISFEFDDKLAKMLYDNIYKNKNIVINDIDKFCKKILEASNGNYSGTVSKYIDNENNRTLDIIFDKKYGNIKVDIKDDKDVISCLLDGKESKGYINGKLGFSVNLKDKIVKKYKTVKEKYELLDSTPITEEQYEKINRAMYKVDGMFSEIVPELKIQVIEEKIKKDHSILNGAYKIKELENGEICLESRDVTKYDLGDKYLFYDEVKSMIMNKNGECHKKSSFEFFNGFHREEKNKIAEVILDENEKLIINQLKGNPVDKFIEANETHCKLNDKEYNIQDELQRIKDDIEVDSNTIKALKRVYHLGINKVNNEIENSKDNEIEDLTNENNQVSNKEHEQLIDEKQELTTDEIILNNGNNEETKAVEEKNKVGMEQNEKVSDNMIEDELLGYSIEELEKMDVDLDKEIEDITTKNEELSKRIELIERIQNKMGKTKSLKMEYKEKIDILKNKEIK